MVQVLPRAPSALEQLLPYMEQAGSAIGKIVEHQKVSNIMDKMNDPKTTAAEKQKLQTDLTRITAPQYLPMMLAGQSLMDQMNKPPASPMGTSGEEPGITRVDQNNPEQANQPAAQPTEAFSPARQRLATDKSDLMGQKNKWLAMTMNPLYAEAAKTQIGSIDKEIDRIEKKEAAYLKQDIKTEASTEVKKDRQANLQRVVNEMSDMIAKDRPGIGISPQTKLGLSREGVQNRNEFNTMRSRIESVLLPMVNKGTLARERFNFILSLIPKAEESQRAIAGKLKGLSKALEDEGFPISLQKLEKTPWLKSELTPAEKKARPPLSSFVRK